MSILLTLISIIFIVFYMVILWKFAVKTGRPGWSLYIPIYSNFVWCGISKLDTIWCILSFAPSIIMRMYPANLGIIIASNIFSLVVSFVFCQTLAKRFNKGFGYTIGLFILNPIFLAILAFNKKCVYRSW